MSHPLPLRRLALAFGIVATLALLPRFVVHAETLRPIPPAEAIVAPQGMVVAQEAHAARIGADVLRRGGNAVDAAVAVGFALAVTYPRAGNIGGGGFMLIRRADGAVAAIDYRETAPEATTPDVFLDAAGAPDPHRSRETGLSVGVPGTVAGLVLALEQHGSGRFSLAELVAPAIRLAREGFPVADDVADSLPRAADRLLRWPSSAKIFARPDGRVLQDGDRLVQADLAATLAAIARQGPRAFYGGPIADRIVAAVRAAGGRMALADLENYRALVRRPVEGRYRGVQVVSMPPPSSGGVHLIQMLNILEGYNLAALGAAHADTLHLKIEAMKRAYADRAAFLGDPDAVRVPVAGLTSKTYAARLRAAIDPLRARPAAAIRPGDPPLPGGDDTTHFSVVDRDGMAVANTYTLNFSYGLGLVAEGTGILLNNQLDDFTAKPMAANAYGLVGLEANLPGPNKRPLSSMTPTIVLKEGRPILVTGSPGGSRIITAVLQVITNVIDHGMDVAAAVSFPRVHHQWLPDTVFVESGLPASVLDVLATRGHAITLSPPRTSANSIAVTATGRVGAADPRTRGALAIGH